MIIGQYGPAQRLSWGWPCSSAEAHAPSEQNPHMGFGEQQCNSARQSKTGWCIYLNIDKGLIHDCLKAPQVFDVQHAQDGGCHICCLVCNMAKLILGISLQTNLGRDKSNAAAPSQVDSHHKEHDDGEMRFGLTCCMSVQCCRRRFDVC